MALRHAFVVIALLAPACKKDEAKPSTSAAETPAAKPADKPADPVAKTAEPAVKPTEPAVAAAPAEVTFKTYTSKEGKFTIDLPGEAKEQDQGGMKIVGAEFGVTSADSRTAMCGIAYMALPPAAADGDPKVMLDGATTRHKSGDAKVIEEKDITIGKHPGRSLIVENSSHRKWMRAYIINKSIYLLNCGGPFDRASTDEKVALKALDSFKLTK